MRYVSEFAATVLVLGLAGTAHAGDLAGVVHDGEGAAAPGMQLSIEALDRQTLSASDGSYRFDDLPAGEHEIALKLASGRKQYATVEIAETGEINRNIFQFTPLALSSVRQAVPAHEPVLEGETLDAVLELADSMTQSAPQAWRWRDLDS